MKKLLTIICAVVLVFCASPLFSNEGLKTLKIPNTDFKLTLPEQAPDFLGFPTDVVAQLQYSDENGVLILESLNKEHTVDVITVIAKIGPKVGVIQMQVNYCEETFEKLDLNKKHLTDYYEDVTFVKSGRLTGVLTRVPKLTDAELLKQFLVPGSDKHSSSKESFDPDKPKIRI